MTITPKLIAEMRLYSRIDRNLEALLLERYGTEPLPYIYTEQDLHEQTRKFIAQYNRDHAVALTNRSKPGVIRPPESTENTGGLCS